MSDTDETESSGEELSEATEDVAALAVTQNYKVLGELSDASGIGVLGQNNDSSGTPVAIKGVVPNADGYGLDTPDDARVEGTLATTGSHEVTVDGSRGLEIGSTGTDSFGDTAGGNVVAGYSGNATNGAVGATIGGGGNNVSANEVFDNYGTIGGGASNEAGDEFADGTDNATHATVGGGSANRATGSQSTVAGGAQNNATNFNSTVGGGFANNSGGNRSTIPGGGFNQATGRDSFATGNAAGAKDNNSFVWNDGTGYTNVFGNVDGLTSSDDVASSPSGVTGANTFHVGATGGVRIVTGSEKVTYISSGSTGWATTSTRAAKTNVDPVDPQQVLDGVTEMPVSTWEYTDDEGEGTGERHIGPMAESFHETVDVGHSDDHINAINADGVAFAAIQGLAERAEAREDRIADLEAENERLSERNETLEERLADLEATVTALSEESHPAPADD